MLLGTTFIINDFNFIHMTKTIMYNKASLPYMFRSCSHVRKIQARVPLSDHPRKPRKRDGIRLICSRQRA